MSCFESILMEIDWQHRMQAAAECKRLSQPQQGQSKEKRGRVSRQGPFQLDMEYALLDWLVP